MMFGIFPACLPLQTRRETIGIHSGWSSPIPLYILTQFAPGFTKIYRDFFKQAHYKMEIFDRCLDANTLAVTGDPAQFPTNTYYPPGKVKTFPIPQNLLIKGKPSKTFVSCIFDF